MLPYNFLLFPIIGGFYLLTNLEYFRYSTQRISPQAMIFNSVIMGTYLLFIAFVICSSLTYLFPTGINFIKQNYYPVVAGVSNAYFGTAVCSFMLAIVLTLIGNAFVDEQQAIARTITKMGNELELIFKLSCHESEPLQVTLKNNKVYIGYIALLSKPQPSDSNYAMLLPLACGYKNINDDTFHITQNYSRIYAHYIAKGEIRNIQDLKISLVIHVNEIISATNFDYRIFEQFSSMQSPKPIKRRRKNQQPDPIGTIPLMDN